MSSKNKKEFRGLEIFILITAKKNLITSITTILKQRQRVKDFYYIIIDYKFLLLRQKTSKKLQGLIDF